MVADASNLGGGCDSRGEQGEVSSKQGTGNRERGRWDIGVIPNADPEERSDEGEAEGSFPLILVFHCGIH